LFCAVEQRIKGKLAACTKNEEKRAKDNKPHCFLQWWQFGCWNKTGTVHNLKHSILGLFLWPEAEFSVAPRRGKSD